MTWLTFLWAAAFIAAIAAVVGIKPKGARHVANTGLIGVARVVLFVMALVVAYYAYTYRAG
jgi:hypothetical protein